MAALDRGRNLTAITILSGERGVGKSCLCLKLAALIRQAVGSRGVAGVITLRSGDEPNAIAIPRSALFLPSRKRLPLADVATAATEVRKQAEGPALGPYRFHQRTIDEVNALFRGGLRADGAGGRSNKTAAQVSQSFAKTAAWDARPRDAVWILDEVGPLELHHGRGFAGALDEIRRVPETCAIIVVRPALVATVRGYFHNRHIQEYWASRETRETAASELYALVAGL